MRPGLKTLDWVVKNGLEADLMVILDMHEYNAMADDPVAKKRNVYLCVEAACTEVKDQPDKLCLNF